jgi:enoyl-[acyl-carrier protein] reductase II
MKGSRGASIPYVLVYRRAKIDVLLFQAIRPEGTDRENSMSVFFDNRVTRMLGVSIPIANAPMGFVVTPELVSAVSNAGGLGMVPGSVGSAYAQEFIRATRAKTNRPFGINIPVSFADPGIVDTILELGVQYVTTSTGPVAPFTGRLQSAGVKVFHAVTSLDAAKRAAQAGVDGLIVESSEGAGMRGDVAMMVLLPLIASEIDLPLIAAGGIADGRSMAAAFALGAEGVQMGTRMLATAESSVHENFKRAVVGATDTDTILLNRHLRQPVRVLRTATTEAHEFARQGDSFKTLLPGILTLYREGDMESGCACVGEVSGRIKELLPVAEVMNSTVKEFRAVVERLSKSHLSSSS